MKKRAEYQKQWKQENKEKYSEYQKEWYKNNKQKFLEYKKKWRKKNKERENTKKRERYHSDINFKLTNILRARLNNAVKNDQKAGSAVDDLGCSIEEFKQHIESKFEDWMSWDNHGDWHLDHIVPLSRFDLSIEEELKKACHYTNIQPLKAEDNYKKQ